MKKTFLVCAVIGGALVGLARAEMLFTAQPIGPGRWTSVVGYVNNVNVSNNPDLTGPTLYAHIGFGLARKTDLILQGGVCYVQGLPAPTSLTGSDIGLTIKHQLFDAQTAFVSLAVHATVRLIHYRGGGGLNTDKNGTTSKIGLVISKVYSRFIPYISLAYQLSTLNGKTAAIWNPTIGVSFAWSEHGTFFVEDTYQMYHPPSGGAYNTNQYAFGVGYSF